VKSIDFSTVGIPVEIGRIDRELGRLWESTDDTKTRASLINLAICSADPASLEPNTALIAEIAGQHACRAILILVDPDSPDDKAGAWISAHCHLAGKGGRQICSEQITFLLEGQTVEALPNIVFSHLDSDLPLCFWWQGDLPASSNEGLWTWVDRLIFDSSDWKSPAEQFAGTREIAARAPLVLCDLNWTRLYRCRYALASIFDHAGALACLSSLCTVRIVCAPGSRTTAVLLLGWLATQLGWKLCDLLSEHYFIAKDGRQVSFEIAEEEGATISLVQLRCGDACFELRRAEGSDYFHGRIHTPGAADALPTLSAGRERLSDVLLAELSRGGRHPVYARAVDAILPLLGSSAG